LSYTATGNKFANKSTVQSSIIAASSKSNTMNAVAEVMGDNQSQNRLRAFVGKELRGNQFLF
jgi:hypothetical protein